MVNTIAPGSQSLLDAVAGGGWAPNADADPYLHPTAATIAQVLAQYQANPNAVIMSYSLGPGAGLQPQYARGWLTAQGVLDENGQPKSASSPSLGDINWTPSPTGGGEVASDVVTAPSVFTPPDINPVSGVGGAGGGGAPSSAALQAQIAAMQTGQGQGGVKYKWDPVQGIWVIDTTGGSNMALNPDQTIWEVDPLQAYKNQLGIGAVGLTPYQKWQQAQFNPTYATYLAGSQLNPPAAGGVAGNFGDYLSQTGIQGARTQAPGLFNQIGGLAPEQQRGFWENISGYANDLLANVLGQRYGTPMASQMGEKFAGLQSAFAGGPGYANEQASFLDYLRQKYAL